MNLTEPQCGTDLGLIKTKAEPSEAGFELSGQKIWISSGDQDLTKEIVHLVLAREPELEEGIKGVSLFLVPSHFIQDGNFTSERNAVSCIGLEDKMGIHASPTCVMSFEKAWGVRIGEPGKGVRQMFVMMNAARLLVAGQGLAGAAAAWRESKAFALERRAGQAVGRPPVEGSVPIIKHADVRRMVLEQEAFLKAGWMALCWGGALMEETGPRKALLDLLIPVLKSTLTDKGLESALTAQQLMGGMGFVRDGKVESIVRDLRITTVYEGTNGIQALDLVGRKLMAQGGAGVRLFLEKMKTVSTDSVVQDSLNAAIEDLEAILKELMTWGITDPERVTGVMVDVQEAFGLVLLGGCLAASGDELRAQFWAQRHLGKTRLLLDRVKHSEWVKDTFKMFD
jgi:acyl-CoA dehydrogenase